MEVMFAGWWSEEILSDAIIFHLSDISRIIDSGLKGAGQVQ